MAHQSKSTDPFQKANDEMQDALDNRAWDRVVLAAVRGADPKEALVIAITDKRLDVLDGLIRLGAKLDGLAWISKATRRAAPLHAAVIADSPEAVDRLITSGAAVNVRDDDGYTPLTLAIDFERSAELAQRLLQHGADPNMKTRFGDTSLHLAVKKEDSQATAMLMQYGADPQIKDKNRRTSMAIAQYIARETGIHALTTALSRGAARER